MALILPPARDVFSCNMASDPWNKNPEFAPYDTVDIKAITSAASRACGLEIDCAMVPVMKYTVQVDGLYFYVAIKRNADNLLNILQVRIEFKGKGSTVLQRQVYVPESMKLLFPYMQFESAQLSENDVFTLFWKALNTGTKNKIERLLVDRPQFALLSPVANLSVVMHPKGFTNPAILSNRVKYTSDQLIMLSAGLLECVARPEAEFSLLVPGLDNEELLWFTVIWRRDTEINITYFDHEHDQYRVDFSGSNIDAFVPGFTTTSNRLMPAKRGDLIQAAVFEYWNGRLSCNRIAPVQQTIAAVLAVAHKFGFNRSPSGGCIGPFDPDTCKKIQYAIASMISGLESMDGVLVPVGTRSLAYEHPMAFVAISCSVRCFKLVVVFAYIGREVQTREVHIPDSWKQQFPHLTFESSASADKEFAKTLLWGTLRAEWIRRCDQLAIVKHSALDAFDVKIEYLSQDPTGLIYPVEYNSADHKRVAKLITVMVTYPLIPILLVPLKHEGPFAFTGIFRRGPNELLISHFVKPEYVHDVAIRVTGRPSIKLVSSSGVDRNYNTIGFEQPNLDYATAEAEKTLRLWTWTPSPRIIAVLMAFHGRLGALSSMRCIAHDVGIVKLCVGGEKRD